MPNTPIQKSICNAEIYLNFSNTFFNKVDRPADGGLAALDRRLRLLTELGAQFLSGRQLLLKIRARRFDLLRGAPSPTQLIDHCFEQWSPLHPLQRRQLPEESSELIGAASRRRRWFDRYADCKGDAGLIAMPTARATLV
jgi:hypothetical protein